jgi:hypothetical protein
MGCWSIDMIGGDSTLEVAMEMLTAAGIGPENYAERAKEIKVVVHTVLKNGKQEPVFVGRHTPAEYAEFFDCVEQAKDKRNELELGFSALAIVASKWTQIFENMGDEEDMNGVGNGLIMLAWLMMNAGAVIPDGFKAAVTQMLDLEEKYWPELSDAKPRTNVRNNFRKLLADYSDATDNTVALGYSTTTYALLSLTQEERKFAMTPEGVASRNYIKQCPPRTFESPLMHGTIKRQEDMSEEEYEEWSKAIAESPVMSNCDPRIERGVRAHRLKECGHCGKPEVSGELDTGEGDRVKLSTCGRCGVAVYCSKECQKADWKNGHKRICSAADFDFLDLIGDALEVIPQDESEEKV